MERYDFIWLLMSATEGNEEVKDGFLAVLVVLSEGKLDPAASPPRPLLLCPPSVSHLNYRNPTSSSSFSLHASWTIAQEDAQPTVAVIWCCRFTS